jgi:AraC-like DNA-binding protein
VLAKVKSNRTVSELAKALGMNRSYFQRLFKSEFGVSPSEWLISHRCEYIVEYLHEHDVPLKVAADDLEFSSMSQLSDYCRKYLGRTARSIQMELKH